MQYTFLTSRRFLRLTGNDRVSFLQALISNDAHLLEKGAPVYAALLTPQGKFLHDFLLIEHEGSILLDCNITSLEKLHKRLQLYKLHSDVTIEIAEMQVAALWGDDVVNIIVGDDIISFVDPRYSPLGIRLIGNHDMISKYCKENQIAKVSEEKYQHHRIIHGIPDGTLDLITEKSFLLEWGIDQLNGVDYKKGCYIGQEVTARTHYRGQIRKAPYIIESSGKALPVSGSKIQCGEAAVGEMRSSVGSIGIALLRIAEVEKSLQSKIPLHIADIIVKVKLPLWFNEK